MVRIKNESIKEVVIALNSTCNSLMQRADRAIKADTQLNVTQLLIINAILHSECISQQDLAQMLSISQPAISKQLNSLIAKDLATEVKSSKRSWTIQLTKQGEKEFHKAFSVYDTTCNDYFRALGDQGLQQLLSLLKKL